MGIKKQSSKESLHETQAAMTIPDCTALKSDMNALILGTLCISAILFLVFMSILEHRSSFKLHCFHGRLGPVIPLNLLDGYENRFAYSLAFGVTTSYCISIIFNDAQSVLGETIAKIIASSPAYVNVFFKIIATVVLATGAYPLFVCVGTRHRIYGSAFGLVYTGTWFSLFCYKTSRLFQSCFSKVKELMTFDLIMELPQYICLIFLMIHFIRVIFLSLRDRLHSNRENEPSNSHKNDYMYKYVEKLIRRKHENSRSTLQRTLTDRITTWCRRKIYQCKPDFKFSTRVTCTFFVCFLAIYMLTVYLIELAWIFLDNELEPWINSSEFNKTFGNSFGPQFVNAARSQVKIWTSCCYIAILVSSLKTYIVFLNMLCWYRHHLMRLRMGDRSWLPKSIKTLSDSPASLTAASMKYAGYQVAYATWGYWIFAFVFWLVLGLCSSLIFYPLFHGESSVLLTSLYTLWPALLITICLFVAQWVTARYCFLFKKGKIITITNRKAFNIMSYYLFFFNIFLGILSCLLRIMKSLVVGVVFLERVQKSVLPSSFEIIDPGYFAYIGCIQIEHTLANPVLRIFLRLLKDDAIFCSERSDALENLATTCDKSVLQESEGDIAMATERYRIVRNKWNLAYTLIKNPALLRFRETLKNVKHETGKLTSERIVSVMNMC